MLACHEVMGRGRNTIRAMTSVNGQTRAASATVAILQKGEPMFTLKGRVIVHVCILYPCVSSTTPLKIKIGYLLRKAPL
jgi:hypothetical protein